MCALAVGCSTSNFVGVPLSPQNQRLVQLAGDVEAGGDYDTAAILYARAAEATNNAPAALLPLGNAYLKTGKYDAASETYAKVLAANPEHPEALLGLGTAQLKQGNIAGGVGTLARAAPLVDTATAYNRLGTALILAGRFDEAINAFGKAQSLRPSDLDTEANIALAQALSGKTDVAIATMQKIARSPHAQPRHRANLVMVLGMGGRMDDARAVEVPNMSPAQRRELLARVNEIHNTSDPLAKARAIGLLGAV